MMKLNRNRIPRGLWAAAVVLPLIALFLSAAIAADAQRRDYLTEDEIELVRDAQQIDLRIKVLARAVDRRIAVLKNETPKESKEWGPLPQGTPAELYSDIDKLLEKAIDDIDDVAERSRDSRFFPKAVFKLSDSCREYIPQFKTFIDAVKNEKERGSLLGAIEKCDEVIEASTKVPREPEKNEKKKN
ncbi:MAG: hypothetical protein JSS81_00295 [Acidobacteria bacterium]|nr:hypothetical protein [Acidobacteriota bacterium]